MEGSNWSHIVVLEYFRAVADFLKGEETRSSMRWDGVVEGYGQWGQRSRTCTVVPPRRRRATMMRRSQQTHEQASEGREDGQFTWKRSYTR